MIPDRDDPRWGPIPLPSWVEEIRPHQWDAVAETLEAYERGDDVVFLEAPTGSGKSLIAELVRRTVNTPTTYACTTKALQDQLADTLPYAKVVKGRSNYLTQLGIVDENGMSKRWGRSAITCLDCNRSEIEEDEGEEEWKCSWCRDVSQCSYQVAKREALQARLAVVNTSYLLTVAMGRNNFTRPFLVIDEADTLEDELLRHLECVVGERTVRELGMPYPKLKTVESSWVEWSKVAWEIVEAAWKALPPTTHKSKLAHVRQNRKLYELYLKLHDIQKELPNGGWVYDGYTRAVRDDRSRVAARDERDGPIIFRPVRVAERGHDLLWSHTRKALLMSATILSDRLMAEDVGIVTSKEGQRPLTYSLVKVPSTFPVENRPIHVVPVADMSHKNRAVGWDEMVEGVRAVLARHPHERILIHTVSYKLAHHLMNGLYSGGVNGEGVNRKIVSYDTSDMKDEALKEFKSNAACVLIASSMDRGVDLPDDLCRVQIVAKIPFPNLDDKRISARRRGLGGQTWYRMQAIRTLVQMTGRGVRSKDDHAVTYILDSQFLDNLWQSRFLFPDWWKEALQFRLTKKHLLG